MLPRCLVWGRRVCLREVCELFELPTGSNSTASVLLPTAALWSVQWPTSCPKAAPPGRSVPLLVAGSTFVLHRGRPLVLPRHPVFCLVHISQSSSRHVPVSPLAGTPLTTPRHPFPSYYLHARCNVFPILLVPLPGRYATYSGDPRWISCFSAHGGALSFPECRLCGAPLPHSSLAPPSPEPCLVDRLPASPGPSSANQSVARSLPSFPLHAPVAGGAEVTAYSWETTEED